jgi:hypothetical protein
VVEVGAGDGLRTRYLNLGKVALYRVSYSRVSVTSLATVIGAGDGNRTHILSLEGWCTAIVLHPRGATFKYVARAGFEPAISGLKGRRPSPLDERAESL